MSECITRKEAAKILGVNEDTIRSFINNKQLDLKRFGMQTRVTMESVEALSLELAERRRLRITSDKWINRGDIL